jgi:quercetin dioxygenase-like cupin family protein
MEEKHNDSTPQRPQGERTIDASLVTINLISFIEQIKEEKPWKDSDRNAITVFKANGMRIVLIALHKGAEMIRHVADGMISLQVLEGNIIFNMDKHSVELGKGQMLTLHEHIPHSVLAKDETIFLLTLTTTLVKE